MSAHSKDDLLKLLRELRLSVASYNPKGVKYFDNILLLVPALDDERCELLHGLIVQMHAEAEAFKSLLDLQNRMLDHQAQLRAAVDRLKVENSELGAENSALKNRIAELEAELRDRE